VGYTDALYSVDGEEWADQVVDAILYPDVSSAVRQAEFEQGSVVGYIEMIDLHHGEVR
jgi:hypothetical protein